MEEKKYFEYVKNYINDKLKEEVESFDDLEFRFRRDPERYYVPYTLACQTIKVLEKSKEKPYFARIDFKEEGKEIQKAYIGRNGIMDNDANSIVIDWKAPISSMYYDSEIGKTSYESPEGQINGELLLKRQFEIENGVLQNYFDVDLVSSDDLLQKYLNTNNDVRLKNIVSTIQKEQNMAIRKPIGKNVIVQGVAGSGKTTIALHRIAYLVYNYRNKIKNSQYLVIGPNDVFLKYIKSVLPDLDVDGIEQKTFEDFAKEVIGEEITVRPSSKYLNKYLTKKVYNDIPKFKSSLEFRDLLDLYIDDYMEDICKFDLEMKGYVLLEKKKLKLILEVALEESNNFEEAIDRFILLASSYIEKNYGDIVQRFNDESYQRFEISKKKGTVSEHQKEKQMVRNEIDKFGKTLLRKYITKFKTTPTKLYKKFISDIKKYDVFDYPYLSELQKETLQNIKEGIYDFEDLAPLMHIKYRLGIRPEEKEYRHIVVDEAQDLGKFNYAVLKECLPNATFSIFGDIAQSIYDYRSIDSWEDVQKILENAELLSFSKSYRTTDEIMEVANAISTYLNIPPSELSVRHGEDVLFTNVEEDEMISCIKEKIEKYQSMGYHSIAIISKYPLQTSYLNDDLSFEGVVIPNIEEKTDVTKMESGVATISNYLSKGLEFDVVILHNAGQEVYDSSSNLDMKMLYVALTRALHKLDIVYTGEITGPLQKFVKPEKQKVKEK